MFHKRFTKLIILLIVVVCRAHLSLQSSPGVEIENQEKINILQEKLKNLENEFDDLKEKVSYYHYKMKEIEKRLEAQENTSQLRNETKAYENVSESVVQLKKKIVHHDSVLENFDERLEMQTHKTEKLYLMEGKFKASEKTILDIQKRLSHHESISEEFDQCMHKNNACLKEIKLKHNRNLHSAANIGNEEEVRSAIRLGANIEYQDSDGNRPLHVASRNNHLAVVKVLLDSKADANSHGKDNATALHLTSNKECVQILLEAGADVESRDRWLDTPLIRASSYGHVAVARYLLEHNANVNAVQINKYSALHMASRYGYMDLVRLLTVYNIDKNLQNSSGKTALDVAFDNKHYNIVRFLE